MISWENIVFLWFFSHGCHTYVGSIQNFEVDYTSVLHYLDTGIDKVI